MSYLIVGDNNEQQKKEVKSIYLKEGIELKRNNPDILIIKPEKSIGIENIREIKKFLLKKSWHEKGKKLVLVFEAHTLTTDAQNAFLKTLEEPPKDSVIILIANNKNAFLPTIVSRCRLIKLKRGQQKEREKIRKVWQEVANSPPEKRLLLSEKIAKEDSSDWLKDLITYLQKSLLKDGDKKTIVNQIKLINQGLQMSNHNVNFQKVLEWIFLQL